MLRSIGYNSNKCLPLFSKFYFILFILPSKQDNWIPDSVIDRHAILHHPPMRPTLDHNYAEPLKMSAFSTSLQLIKIIMLLNDCWPCCERLTRRRDSRRKVFKIFIYFFVPDSLFKFDWIIFKNICLNVKRRSRVRLTTVSEVYNPPSKQTSTWLAIESEAAEAAAVDMCYCYFLFPPASPVQCCSCFLVALLCTAHGVAKYFVH